MPYNLSSLIKPVIFFFILFFVSSNNSYCQTKGTSLLNQEQTKVNAIANDFFGNVKCKNYI